MSNSSIPFQLSTNALCLEIESLLQNGTFSAVQFVQLALLSITLISIGVLFVKYHRLRVAMHGNLLLLFANIIAVYFFFNFGQFMCILRYRFLLLVYTDPCQLLTPIWMVCLMYGPTYFYYLAYPAFHFCVMIERFRATLLAERYEKEDKLLGILMSAGNWFVSLAFMAFVICAALADTDLFGSPQGVMFLTSKYNNLPNFYVSIFTLLLTILTAICDWKITMVNRRIRNSSHTYSAYSLSRNYQLNENAMAMRLILPLDTAYALIYSVYNLISIILRAHRASLGTKDFAYYYTLLNTLLFFYCTLTMIVYIRFMEFVRRCQRRNVIGKQRKSVPEAKIYFRQLEEQWR